MNNISFGSNYKFDITSNFPFEVINKAYSLEGKGARVYERYTPFEESMKTGVFQKVNVSIPDGLDVDMETYLANKGVKFHKQTFAEAINLDSIKSRIQVDPDSCQGRSLVELDTYFLDDLFKKDGISHLESNGEGGIQRRFEGVKQYFQSGEPINATKVCFNEDDGILRASIIDGRHRFAVLRDLGMKKIPVEVDTESCSLLKRFGILI